MSQLRDPEVKIMAWSDLYPGVRVRWSTPAFIKRGVIRLVKGRSMKVRFDGHDKDTIIPMARWYFYEGKAGNLTEHLVVINTKAPRQPKSPALAAAAKALEAGKKNLISPAQAANILGVDSKAVRRMIRAGKLKATQQGGRWVLNINEVRSHRR